MSGALREGWFEAMLAETSFLRRYPHFAGVLARMDAVATNVVDTMAVGLRRLDDPESRFQLLINAEYFAAHPDEIAPILLHEIQHVVLGHLTSPKFHAVMHPKLMELAMELSADEFVPEPLPSPGLAMKWFVRFGVRPGQSTMERYRLLADAYERGELKIQDFWFARMRDTHRPVQRGACRAAGLGDLIDARSDGATAVNWSRAAGRRLGAPSSAAELRRMKEAILAHLRGDRGGADDQRNASKRRVPKDLSRVVMERGAHLELDWRRILREAFPLRRQVRPDYLRPNRRFPARVGEIPGRRRQPPLPRLLVGIDTSGSMDGAALDRIAREVGRLAPHARLTIAECDAAVHRVYPLTRRLQTFIGGGDTDFGPVFDEAGGANAFEGLVYFTDGKGRMPDAAQRVPTLWVLTHDDPFEPEFGNVVRMAAGSS